MTYNENLYTPAGTEDYPNTCFILDHYKTSTLPRLFYDLEMSVKQIDNSKVITEWLNSVEAMEGGYAQDDLFEVIWNSKK